MFDLLQRLTQSSTQLQICAKDVPLLLPKAYGLGGATQAVTRLLGVRPGAGSVSGCGTTTAWGSSRLAAKFPLHFRHYGTDFLLAKAPALQTSTILTAVKLIGCLRAKVKLKYISKCLQDQGLIQA